MGSILWYNDSSNERRSKLSYVMYINDEAVIVIPADKEKELVPIYEKDWDWNLTDDFERVEASSEGDVISFRAKLRRYLLSGQIELRNR